MKTWFLSLFLLFFGWFGAKTPAQELYCDFTHYSQDDGLSQNTVMSILQDDRGMMWFSTWNGLNRFDGNSFFTHKVQWGNPTGLTNSRIDHIEQDHWGRIWCITYNKQVCLFDIRTEQFFRIPAEGEAGSKAPIYKIGVLQKGVWMFSEQGGAGRVTIRPDGSLTPTQWFPPNRIGRVREVVEDNQGDEWLLTDNGLYRYSPSDQSDTKTSTQNSSSEDPLQSSYSQLQPFFKAPQHQPCNDFLSVCKGRGILSFGGNGGRIWRYHEETATFDSLHLKEAESPVVKLQRLSEGTLVAVTAREGIYLIHPQSMRNMEHYPLPEGATQELHEAYVDAWGEVWTDQQIAGRALHFSTEERVWRMEQIQVEPTSTDRSRPAFHVHEDLRGTVWVHPYGGGFSYYDRTAKRLRPFYNSMGDGNWRFSNKIHSAYSDRQGNLWLCTHSKGLEKITFGRHLLGLIVPVPLPYESLSNEVRSLMEDSQHRIWAGTKDGKLRIYDQLTEQGYLTEQGIIAKQGTPLRGNVYAMAEDRLHNLWIATKGDGLVKAEPLAGGKSYRLKRFTHQNGDDNTLSDNNVYSIYEDTLGRIWVATYGGGINIIPNPQAEKPDFIHARNGLKHYPITQCYRARFVTGDNEGRIWIGTTQGALVANEHITDMENLKFVHLRNETGDEHSLSNNDVHWVLPVSNGEIYLATLGGGLNRLVHLDMKRAKASFQTYGTREGLASESVFSIREDNKGNLWMSTENGIACFAPSTNEFVNFDEKEVATHLRFSEAASTFTSRGDMLFGTSNGICHFNPDSTKLSTFVPPMVLTGLKVWGRDVAPDPKSLLPAAPDELDKLVLTHSEKVFSLRFAALDYTNSHNIQYAYIMEGFERGWNYVGNTRTATYTNLPKGNYLFKVRSTNADGVWTDNVRTLPVTILPSFWETTLAYFIYVLLVLIVIVVAAYILFTIYRLKHEVKVEQQLTHMKLRFFTDISHELRTPLTLIAAPVEHVLKNNSLPEEARRQLEVVERNTNRMLRLINQILDFRKIQNKKMKMMVQRIEVVEFSKRLMENFRGVAEERNIDFRLVSEPEQVYLWADTDKLEKILFNLISNAFKYTPDGKEIRLKITQEENKVKVSVKDQGIGIEESKQGSIFLRFENLVDRNLFHTSTGIGLSLVQELVEMHKASIEVKSRPGEGSNFIVTFQAGRNHFDPSAEFLPDDGSAAILQTSPEEVEAEVEGNRQTLLIVEDNAELRLFLRTLFAGTYAVAESENGEEGWKKALECQPDLIVSDVMMPVMNGIEMLKRLRSDLTTSHIPVILLSAKTSIENQIEGLEYGADAYVTKPFSATFLKARVKSLLAGRKLLQTAIRSSLMPASSQMSPSEEDMTSPHDRALPAQATPEESVAAAAAAAEESAGLQLSPHDRKFMDKLMALMEKNIDNGELVVDDLVQEMAVSRSVFFKKLKTLTGLAPVEFIKEVRINRAIELIDSGEYSMTQISYMVGINDPRYFSKCFKSKMGMTPTEFRDRKKS